LKERIFDPLGMNNTGYEHHERIIRRRASGYMKTGLEFKNAAYISMDLVYANGAIYSTVEDLYKWDQALYTDKLLSEQMKQKMFEPFLNDYACGWKVYETKYGKKAVAHSGGINGFNSYIYRIVDDRHLIVLLNNFLGANLWEILQNITSILYDKPCDMPLPPISLKLFDSIEKIGINAALAEIRELYEDKEKKYRFSVEDFISAGMKFMREKKYNDASKIYICAAGLFPPDLFPEACQIYYRLGDVYSEMDEKESAIKNYARALQIYHEYPAAARKIIELLKQ